MSLLSLSHTHPGATLFFAPHIRRYVVRPYEIMISDSVISWQGYREDGFDGFRHNMLTLNLWPESLSAASSWFGVVVFGFGVAPFVFNFR